MLPISSFYKISRYTFLVIISSKILITLTPLLDIQPHTITVCIYSKLTASILFTKIEINQLLDQSSSSDEEELYRVQTDTFIA